MSSRSRTHPTANLALGLLALSRSLALSLSLACCGPLSARLQDVYEIHAVPETRQVATRSALGCWWALVASGCSNTKESSNPNLFCFP